MLTLRGAHNKRGRSCPQTAGRAGTGCTIRNNEQHQCCTPPPQPATTKTKLQPKQGSTCCATNLHLYPPSLVKAETLTTPYPRPAMLPAPPAPTPALPAVLLRDSYIESIKAS